MYLCFINSYKILLQSYPPEISPVTNATLENFFSHAHKKNSSLFISLLEKVQITKGNITQTLGLAINKEIVWCLDLPSFTLAGIFTLSTELFVLTPKVAFLIHALSGNRAILFAPTVSVSESE
ncbi:hypothetical protein CEXT_86401 [Caerostris extrusa]|uniref:Uncharacterized protein n=1 Tax=Caerostris extrusa TaxID=172846 RepID=A0AAV4V4E5_CAEEX|nr:hypothetical protein CEXT_86401 [Caerostris extrusa]